MMAKDEGFDAISGLVAAAIFVCVLATGVATIRSRVLDPYMDEIFHVPQTQAYCRNLSDTTYDSKITTPPFPYYAAAALMRLLKIPCTTSALRLVTACEYAGCALLAVAAYEATGASSPTVRAISVLSFPPLMFFGLMFYTDVLSILLMLIVFITMKYDAVLLSAGVAGCAAATRQTNVVWTAFVLGLDVIDALQLPETSGTTSFVSAVFSAVWRRKRVLAKRYALHVLGIFSCVAWVVLRNDGSIVLGDVDNHNVHAHFFQLPFLALVLAYASLPSIANEVAKRRGLFMATVARTSAWSVPLFVLMSHFHVVHPFILSDNRHYTFYVWNRFVLKYAPSSLYIIGACGGVAFASVLATTSVVSAVEKARMCVFGLACALTLVPTPLVEIRYAFMPVVFFDLCFGGRIDANHHFAYVIGNCIIHSILLYVFAFKEFTWNDGSVARFMW